MWDFFEVRKLAIKKLLKMKMNPISRILVARRYMVQVLLFTGYDDLAKDSGPISIAEAKLLGWETAIRIFNIRQKSIPVPMGPGLDFEDEIRKEFAKELKELAESL
jgi:hypothetical protein